MISSQTPQHNKVADVQGIQAVGSSIYETLSVEQREIRLLTVSSLRDIPSCVQCTLRVVSINACEDFMALSYAWGDPTDTISLEVNGQILQVTQNLYSALQHLSQMVNNLVIWVDAICINQLDFSERANQVKMMGDIYGSARHVLVWLGNAFEDSHLGLDMIEKLGNAYHDLRDRELAIAHVSGFQHDEPWIAISRLLKHPWWARVWTLQEVILAKEASVVCGTKCISWNAIYHALSVLKDIEAVVRSNSRFNPVVESQIQDSIYDSRVNTKLHFWASKQTNIHDPDVLGFLSSCRAFEATDPRDKIYACIALAKPIEGFDIEYNTPFHQVYTSFVVKYVKQHESLSILREAGLCSSEGIREHRLPSWVPDWRYDQSQSLMRADLYRASLDKKPTLSISTEKITAKGLLCDEITAIQPNEGGIIASWLKLAVNSQPKIYEPSGIPQIQAFFRTLFYDWNPRTHARLDPMEKSFFSPALDFCCIVATDEEASRALPDYITSFAAESGRTLAQAINICMLQQDDARVKQAYWAWEADAEEANFRPERHIEPFSFSLILGSAARGRCFFMTSSGYMGLAPAGTEEGDLVCVLLGCCVPLVLRYTDGNYVLIGECFVMGLMDGEIFESPDWEECLFDFTIV